MKKMIAAMLSVLMCFTCLTMSGCRTRVSNDDQTLEIYVANFGYGIEWLDAIIAEFEEEDWVKEKYPNLEIPTPSNNSERGYPVDRVKSGTSNTIDLLFGAATINPQIEQPFRDGEGFFENLDSLYESTVPGEDITFREKMDPEFLTMSTFTRTDGTQGFYSVPWVSGMQGMLYNKTVFDSLGIAQPLTTDQLANETCVALKAAGQTPFVFSSSVGYWTCVMFLIWWAQYEGVENYSYFYQGLVPDEAVGVRQSVDVIKQEGRRQSLEVIEGLISSKNEGESDFVHANVNTLDFGQAQARFFNREGMMMPNGDWFENEMRETQIEAEQTGGSVIDTFTFMRSPVISSIIDLCPTVNSDDELQTVIRAVDNGETSCAGVSEEDFARIKEARLIILPVGNHVAYIPSYATAKDVAKDFLLYLATDKANRAYIEATHGANMPFNYDVQTADPELYNSLAQIQKDRLALDQIGIYLMNENTYKMAYFGKMYRMSIAESMDSFFTTSNPGQYRTAEQVYQAEIAYWTEDRWTNALINAGYQV